MTRAAADHATARRAALVATIWAPLAIVVLAEAVVVGVGASAGHDLIIHWGNGGDRTGPWWDYALVVAVTGLPIIVLAGVFIMRAARMAGTNTWMPAITVGVTVFHAVGLGAGPVLLNGSPLAPALPLAAGVILALMAALLTWWLLPREAAVDRDVVAADALPVRTGEVAGWAATVRLPAAFLTVVGGVAVVLLALVVVLVLIVGPRAWPVFLVPTVQLTVLLVTAEFTVTAGPRGLHVRSTMSWPRLTVPIADVATAGVVVIDPLADFGGWGLRWVVGPNHKGRWGLIARRGPALEVVRHDGRTVVITVQGAGSAAAILETYATKRTQP